MYNTKKEIHEIAIEALAEANNPANKMTINEAINVHLPYADILNIYADMPEEVNKTYQEMQLVGDDADDAINIMGLETWRRLIEEEVKKL